MKRISAGVKEGPADCLRVNEVAAALKKMKRHKAPGLSGLVVEMIQATGNIGTQWISDLCKKLELKERSSILALWIWKKLLIGFREKQ